jgi:hypothetical protein
MNREQEAIASSTALTHGLAVATLNPRDFVSAGVELVDPLE